MSQRALKNLSGIVDDLSDISEEITEAIRALKKKSDVSQGDLTKIQRMQERVINTSITLDEIVSKY